MRTHKRLIAATAVFAVAGFAASLASAATTNITIVGAGKGAGAFRMAAGLAEAVNKTSKTVNVTNRESKGFVANTRLVASGRSRSDDERYFRRLHPAKQNPSTRARRDSTGDRTRRLLVPDGDVPRPASDLPDLAARVNTWAEGKLHALLTKFITDSRESSTIRQDYLGWAAAANNMIDGKIAFQHPEPGPLLILRPRAAVRSAS